MAIEQLASIPVPPLTGSATPDVQPWALDAGTQSTPTINDMASGWIAAVPPDFHLANRLEDVRWKWNSRQSCTAFFAQRATYQIEGSGIATGAVLRISYNGTNVDHTVTSAEAASLPVLWANWAAEWRLSSLRDLIDAYGEGGGMFLCYRDPGTEYPHAVTTSTVSGTGTTTATQVIGGSGDPMHIVTQGFVADLPIVHNAGASLGLRAIATHTGELCSGSAPSDGAAQAGQVVGYLELAGISDGQISPDGGASPCLFLGENDKTYNFDVQVSAQRVNAVGVPPVAQWFLRLVMRVHGGVAAIDAIFNSQVVTISGKQYALDRSYDPTAGDDLTPLNDTSSGKFTLKLDTAYAVAGGLMLTGGCTDAAYTTQFVATVRYTTNGLP